MVFLFLTTYTNSRVVRRLGANQMFRIGLLIQFAVGIALVAIYVGCIAMVMSNAMTVILDDFPHMAGTASSLAGTLRFGMGALVGSLLSLVSFTSAWPMIVSMSLCCVAAFLLYGYAARSR